MKASTFMAAMAASMEKHGDLEIMVDCEAMLIAPASVQFFTANYLPQPFLLIKLVDDDSGSNFRVAHFT